MQDNNYDDKVCVWYGNDKLENILSENKGKVQDCRQCSGIDLNCSLYISRKMYAKLIEHFKKQT